MSHPQDCISSMMNPIEGRGLLPTTLDYTVASQWIWTRANNERVALKDLNRKELATLTAFVEKQTKKLSMSLVSYMHLDDNEKAQHTADQLAFLHEATSMLTLEAQRRFAKYLHATKKAA